LPAEIIKVLPDNEKAKSILRMVETTSEMVKQIDADKFPSNVIKEYYDIIRELISIILLLDGFKATGEGAHKMQIDYLEENYKEFDKSEIELIDDLRIKRNKISYDGFFVTTSYAMKRLDGINKTIDKLKTIVANKLH